MRIIDAGIGGDKKRLEMANIYPLVPYKSGYETLEARTKKILILFRKSPISLMSRWRDKGVLPGYQGGIPHYPEPYERQTLNSRSPQEEAGSLPQLQRSIPQ